MLETKPRHCNADSRLMRQSLRRTIIGILILGFPSNVPFLGLLLGLLSGKGGRRHQGVDSKAKSPHSPIAFEVSARQKFSKIFCLNPNRKHPFFKAKSQLHPASFIAGSTESSMAIPARRATIGLCQVLSLFYCVVLEVLLGTRHQS